MNRKKSEVRVQNCECCITPLLPVRRPQDAHAEDFFRILAAQKPTGIFSALALCGRPLAYASTARVVREAPSSENLSVIPAEQPHPNPKEIPCLHVLRTAGKGGAVPFHLRDAHYAGAKALGHGQGYLYAHDHPHGVAAQQYLPDDLADARYYEPTSHGHEAAIAERLDAIRGLLGR